MKIALRLVLIYFCCINLIAFIAFGIDKRRARKNKWRIPELTLIMLAAIGGSAGALIGMFFWHHKTKKLKFLLAIPTFFVLWTIAGLCLII